MSTDPRGWFKSNAGDPASATRRRRFGLLCGLALLGGLGPARSDELPPESPAVVATVKRVSGEVTVVAAGERLPVVVGSPLKVGDELQTGPDGAVGFTFEDHSQLALGPNSVFMIEAFRFDKTTHAGEFRSRVRRGTLGVISGKLAKQSPDAVKVLTPSSILGVSGTSFLVEVPGEAP